LVRPLQRVAADLGMCVGDAHLATRDPEGPGYFGLQEVDRLLERGEFSFYVGRGCGRTGRLDGCCSARAIGDHHGSSEQSCRAAQHAPAGQLPPGRCDLHCVSCLRTVQVLFSIAGETVTAERIHPLSTPLSCGIWDARRPRREDLRLIRSLFSEIPFGLFGYVSTLPHVLEAALLEAGLLEEGPGGSRQPPREATRATVGCAPADANAELCGAGGRERTDARQISRLCRPHTRTAGRRP